MHERALVLKPYNEVPVQPSVSQYPYRLLYSLSQIASLESSARFQRQGNPGKDGE